MCTPKLTYNDLCMVFENCYPTISDGFYSIENSVLSDKNMFGKTPSWGDQVWCLLP